MARGAPSAITPEILLRAYAMGIFPMAESRDQPDIYWVEPEQRGILPLDRFHISRSLKKRILTCGWQVTTDRAFAAVLEGCAAREETWINPQIHRLYTALHRDGFAHSIEVWDGSALIGGAYGVALGAAFFGESMFSRRTDASKLALAWLVHRLRAGGFRLLDTQFLTPHLASLGGIEIPRKAYQALLVDALEQVAEFNPMGYSATSSSVTSSST